MNLHPKVRWAALASSVVVALAAIVTALGASAPIWLGALVAGLAAFFGGYLGPAS